MFRLVFMFDISVNFCGWISHLEFYSPRDGSTTLFSGIIITYYEFSPHLQLLQFKNFLITSQSFLLCPLL